MASRPDRSKGCEWEEVCRPSTAANLIDDAENGTKHAKLARGQRNVHGSGVLKHQTGHTAASEVHCGDLRVGRARGQGGAVVGSARRRRQHSAVRSVNSCADEGNQPQLPRGSALRCERTAEKGDRRGKKKEG